MKFYFSFILIKPIIEIILNKIIGKNTDKYIGILFVNPKTLKILLIKYIITDNVIPKSTWNIWVLSFLILSIIIEEIITIILKNMGNEAIFKTCRSISWEEYPNNSFSSLRFISLNKLNEFRSLNVLLILLILKLLFNNKFSSSLICLLFLNKVGFSKIQLFELMSTLAE